MKDPKELTEEYKKLAPESDLLVDILGDKTKVLINVESFKDCKNTVSNLFTELLLQLEDKFDDDTALIIYEAATKKAMHAMAFRGIESKLENSDMPRSMLDLIKEALGN